MRIPMLVASQRHLRTVVTQFLTTTRRDTYRRPIDRGTPKMSDVKNPTRYTGVDRRAPRGEAAVAKTGGRHAAITNSLYNWHSYKNWAEKARGNFDEKK
jgi:hypothetical protein